MQYNIKVHNLTLSIFNYWWNLLVTLSTTRKNRIISGISNGILVVEAKNKSGTGLTVDFALEQGRDIFAIPGSIYSENSEGTNNLIKNGAKLVDSYMDILEEYNLLKKE